jgi:hypothetical protein
VVSPHVLEAARTQSIALVIHGRALLRGVWLLAGKIKIADLEQIREKK